MSSSPLVSIIIPTLNNVHTIINTIQSIVDQSYKNIELIIIDGGSDDGTIEIINEFLLKLPTDEVQTSLLINEKDEGIYDAMNKGIDQSNGEWLLFLGGDDRLYNNDTLKEVFSDDLYGYRLVYGNVEYDNNRDHKASFDSMLFLKNTIHQQGAFFNIKCFDDFRFNTKYKILSDYELNLLLYKKRIPVKKVNYVISKCGSKGISKNVSIALYQEELKIKSSIFKWYAMPVLFVWVWFKYIIKRFF